MANCRDADRGLGQDTDVEIVGYEARDLDGIVELCRAEEWPSFPADPPRAHRVLTAPGVTAVVARDGETVIGFAYVQSDGEIQAHLSNIVVAEGHRRRGIARRMLQQAIEWAGGMRIDLITDSADDFYAALPHRRWSGFRIYPPFDPAAEPPSAGSET
jgi:ribosomal protein S18 acetylase RimI-like enzyme